MGHKNPDPFFNDPTAINPQTGQLLYPPPAPPQAPPDRKLLAVQARAQVDQASAAHKAQLDQQQAQNDAIHQQIKIQAEIELAKLRAGLDARIALLETYLKTLGETQKMQHERPASNRRRGSGAWHGRQRGESSGEDATEQQPWRAVRCLMKQG